MNLLDPAEEIAFELIILTLEGKKRPLILCELFLASFKPF